MPPWPAKPVSRSFSQSSRSQPIQHRQPWVIPCIHKLHPHSSGAGLSWCAAQPGAASVFLDFISYSDGPLPDELLEACKRPVSILWGACTLRCF